MSVSRSGSTLSPYYVYKAVTPAALGFGNKNRDNSSHSITMAASSSVMIASSKGTTQFDIWYTTNGTSWTRSASAASVFGTNQIQSMCFGNDIFVAVGNNMTIGTSPSTDGGTWTARTKASGASAGATPKRVHFLKNTFFIWDSNAYVQKSTDGITWTTAGSTNFAPETAGSTIIENTSNSALYAFPAKTQSSVAQQIRYIFTPDDFLNRTDFYYSGTNGEGATFVYARNVNGYQMFIAGNGRTSTSTSELENYSANQISVALTTVGASTYANTSATDDAGPAIWPTTHKIPSLTSPAFASNAAAVGLPALHPVFNGAYGYSQAGFWVNYENGYWNLIGNIRYQYGSGASNSNLGCSVLRWKEEDGVLEEFYSVQGGARYSGNAVTVEGSRYNFLDIRTTQTNGGNEVVFNDVVYIPVNRGEQSEARDIIVGRRKIITRNQL